MSGRLAASGRFGSLLGAILLVLPWTGRAEPAVAPPIRVGVAALVGDGPGAGELTAALLTRLAARPGLEVLDPGALGSAVGDEPEASVVRNLGFEHQLDGLVVGRVVAAAAETAATPGARRIEIALRSGHSGGVSSQHRATISGPSDVVPVTERLAAAIAADLGLAPATRAGESPGASAAATVAGRQAPFGLADRDAPLPIEIEAEELEFFALEDESRRLLFRRDVRVVRGDVKLTADELEAFYPPQESQPERLLARGHVRVEQGERSARCEEALYLRSSESLRCSGRAELIFGCDVVRGDTIEFDLATDRARVIGAASVSIRPQVEGGSPPCGAQSR